jgi:hypothetical protein
MLNEGMEMKINALVFVGCLLLGMAGAELLLSPDGLRAAELWRATALAVMVGGCRALWSARGARTGRRT